MMRKVYCEDALVWLKNHAPEKGESFLASLPDISEFPKYSLEAWKSWFVSTATLILEKTHEEGVTLFYQSDIKYEGTWVDKSFLIMKAAEMVKSNLLFHKIICRTKPGIVTFGRPAYSHLIAFSKEFKMNEGYGGMADVVADIGDKTWQRGMGLSACLGVAEFLVKKTKTQTLINPFCGEGSMLAAANALGLSAIGIERSPKRAEKAMLLSLNEEEKKWIMPPKA